MAAQLDTFFYGFDTAIFSAFAEIQTNFLNYIAKFITFFGSANFVYFMIFLSIVLSIIKKTRKYGVALLFALAIGILTTNFILKPSIMRPRPYEGLQSSPFWEQYRLWHEFAGSVTETDSSFPSGHTTAAFSYCTSIFLTARSQKKKWAYPLPIFALLVGLSRIYLMVHYPSDVAFGLLIGLTAGLLGYLISKLLFRERKLETDEMDEVIELDPKVVKDKE